MTIKRKYGRIIAEVLAVRVAACAEEEAMPEQAQDQGGNALLQETITRQVIEIERLKRRIADDRFADELREAFSLTAIAATITSPVPQSRLLEMIVETAAHLITSRGAALFLIDDETQELVFEVALGDKAAEVKKFRVPLGTGIAGLVAVTGQPMAISDAQSDPRQAADIAKAVDYKPDSLLCVPLFFHDQVFGVLELLDRVGQPSYSPEDMEALGLFAGQAAVAIAQSQTQHRLAALLAETLAASSTLSSEQIARLREGADALAARLEEDDVFRRRISLARLTLEIAGQGESETKACEAILRGFAEFLRSQPTMASF